MWEKWKMQESEGEEQRTVFINNLSSCVTEEILYELFLQAGPVQKVVIPRDRDGNQKSYGFVGYKHAEAVPYAVALLDGIWLYGCPITLRRHYDVYSSPRSLHPNHVHYPGSLLPSSNTVDVAKSWIRIMDFLPGWSHPDFRLYHVRGEGG